MSDIRNAIIERATITHDGPLSSWIHLDYGDGSHQAFGGYALHLPKGFSHHKLHSFAGHWMYRVMEIAGVSEWGNLPGRSIRVVGGGVLSGAIKGIGHIIKDDWFYPGVDFADAPKGDQ